MTDSAHSDDTPESGDLSVTALYTSATWAWAGLPYAELFASKDSRNVFRVTNVVLAIAKLFIWGAKSLRHSLVHRHVLIDRIVTASGARQVVELASGLSRRGASFSADPNLRYVEFDLPHVVEKKRALLAESDAGRTVAARSNYTIRSADVLKDPWEDALRADTPGAVVAEGLLMYFEPQVRRELFARVAAALRPMGGVFVFDLVPPSEQPKPGPVGRMLGWLMKRFTRGQGFDEHDVTRASILADLETAGFQSVEALEPCKVAADWNLPYPDRATTQLVFRAEVAPKFAPVDENSA